MMGKITLEYNESEYFIYIESVDEIENNAKGQYIPAVNRIVLIKGCSDSTIYHESIHAVIDMFRSTDESFDGMFYDNFNYGEEAFCHYVCEVAGRIKELL